MLGKIFSGERCILHCAPGFKPAGKRTAVCDVNQEWSPSEDLSCVAVESIQSSVIVPSQQTIREEIVKPYIKCPDDVKLMIPKEQESVLIRLEQPKTNVDWQR